MFPLDLSGAMKGKRIFHISIALGTGMKVRLRFRVADANQRITHFLSAELAKPCRQNCRLIKTARQSADRMQRHGYEHIRAGDQFRRAFLFEQITRQILRHRPCFVIFDRVNHLAHRFFKMA